MKALKPYNQIEIFLKKGAKYRVEGISYYLSP